VWDDFCSWYLEMVKPVYQSPIDPETHEQTISFLEDLLKLLHPFMPFITEEIWHEIKHREVQEALIVTPWPRPQKYDEGLISKAQQIFEVISQIRNMRLAKGISPKEPLELTINTIAPQIYQEFGPVLRKLGNLSRIKYDESLDNALSFVVKSDEFFLPMGNKVDIQKE